jgi:YfiH family protein
MTRHDPPGLTLVRSRLFAEIPGLVFGMSTRHGGVSPPPLGLNLSFHVGDDPRHVAENRSRFFGALAVGQDRIVLPKQVHGTTVREVSAPGVSPECDALMTREAGLFLAVSVADCVPIFLYDPDRSSVAAVHAGWRGSRGRIVERVVGRLCAGDRSGPGRLRAYIGPSAGVCCYEVGEEVGSLFGPEFLRRSTGGKAHLDLKQFNRYLLTTSGVRENNIEVSEDCTICNTSYHSFRRDGNRSGRMYGVIGLQGGKG